MAMGTLFVNIDTGAACAILEASQLNALVHASLLVGTEYEVAIIYAQISTLITLTITAGLKHRPGFLFLRSVRCEQRRSTAAAIR